MRKQPVLERNSFGLPKPPGWTVERAAMILAGSLILATQLARPEGAKFPRLFTMWVAANLVLNGLVGWCPGSVMLYRLGLPTTAELTLAKTGGKRR